MLNPYTLNIQESLKHTWHRGIDYLRSLAAKVLNKISPIVRVQGIIFTNLTGLQLLCQHNQTLWSLYCSES